LTKLTIYKIIRINSKLTDYALIYSMYKIRSPCQISSENFQ